MEAKIIVDLGFGDAGKGNFTNYLCSHSKKPIVIRYCGGQQAGHTVIHNGVKHVFSNFGSGTFQDIPTYFTEHTSVYLNTMFNELKILIELGLNPSLKIHPFTKITTPFDVAYGKAREEKLKHGSCGVGIGSTMDRHENTGYKLYAIDFMNRDIFMAKLESISKYYKEKVKDTDLEEEYYYNIDLEEFLENYKNYKSFFSIIDYDHLVLYDELIFEGAQGIMLDREHGIFPNVTYANTTCKNAVEVCNKLKVDYDIFYITRCYQTRHGAGWMSNTSDIELINNDEEINVLNKWQGDFRVKELDYDLLKWSMNVNSLYCDKWPCNLVVTCLDQRPDFKLDITDLEGGFKHIENIGFFHKVYLSYSPDSKFTQL